jgi:hypothetical protein
MRSSPAPWPVVEQAQNAEGNVRTDVLAEANDAYWTRTVMNIIIMT